MIEPYKTLTPGSVEEINFLDSALQNCPYEAYRILRDDAPIWKDPITGFFVISRFEDMRKVLLDTKNFSNAI